MGIERGPRIASINSISVMNAPHWSGVQLVRDDAVWLFLASWALSARLTPALAGVRKTTLRPAGPRVRPHSEHHRLSLLFLQ